MNHKTLASIAPALMIVLLTILACNIGRPGPPVNTPIPSAIPTIIAVQPSTTVAVVDEAPTEVLITATSPVAHVMKPAAVAVTGKTVYDVESEGTAPEQRAPYGDSYNINRFERPFLQDMTYNANLDLSTYTVGKDSDWYYVSISIVGNDPNDKLHINYGVELDTDHDGFGDYLLLAHYPYPIDWDTAPVQIFHDTNHDTGGLSAEKSDAPLKGDGYDTLVFNGGGSDADPDMAWVRVNNGVQGLVQFAFKRSWSRDVFMLGVLADAGLKNPAAMDYVDRMTLAEAGSPVKDNSNYPLKALYAVDNVCRIAFGFKPTGDEPQLCPMDEPPPPRTPKPHVTLPPPAACPPCGPGYTQDPYPSCMCWPIIK